MTRRPDPDRAFRAALLPLPCPDHARWRTVAHKVCLGCALSPVGGGAPEYFETATDGHRLHARRCPPPSIDATPDPDATLIRAAVELALRGRTERTLELDAAALLRAHGLDAALGKRWSAAVDLAAGAVHGFHAGGGKDPTPRDEAKRAAVLGGPVLAGVFPPEPGAPGCYVRYLLDAVAFVETLTVHFEPDDAFAPLRLASADGARWAIVMPCRV